MSVTWELEIFFISPCTLVFIYFAHAQLNYFVKRKVYCTLCQLRLQVVSFPRRDIEEKELPCMGLPHGILTDSHFHFVVDILQNISGYPKSLY